MQSTITVTPGRESDEVEVGRGWCVPEAQPTTMLPASAADTTLEAVVRRVTIIVTIPPVPVVPTRRAGVREPWRTRR